MKRKEPKRFPIPIKLLKQTRENLIFILPPDIENALKVLGINRVRITFISKDVRKNG